MDVIKLENIITKTTLIDMTIVGSSFIVTANGAGDYFQIYGYTEQSGGSTLQPTDSDSRLMWFCGQKLIEIERRI